jgi:hypothetical protein
MLVLWNHALGVCQQLCRFMMAGDGVKQRDTLQEVVRNRTLTLIEREDDTRSWENFLVYFSHSTTMPCSLRGWGYILIGC